MPIQLKRSTNVNNKSSKLKEKIQQDNIVCQCLPKPLQKIINLTIFLLTTDVEQKGLAHSQYYSEFMKK